MRINGLHGIGTAVGLTLALCAVDGVAQPMVFGRLDSLGHTDVPAPNYRCDVDADGGVAVLGSAGDGAFVIDVNDPTRPIVRSQILTQSFTPDVQVRDTLAYLALGPGAGDYDGKSILIANLADPSNPTVVGTYGHPGFANCQALHLAGHLLYASAFDVGGLEIVDVSDPSNPIHVGNWVHPNLEALVGAYVHDIFVRDTIAYVAYWNAGLQVLNVANPAAPVRIGQLSIPGTTCHSVWVDAGHRAYVVELRETLPYSVMLIIDASDPSDLRILSSESWCASDPLHFLDADDGVPGTVMAAHHTCGLWAITAAPSGQSYVVDTFSHAGDHLGFWGTAFDGRYVYGAHMELGLYVFEFDWAARGDVSGDHVYDARDLVGLIGLVFRTDAAPPAFPQVPDWTCDGAVDALDVVAAVDFVFRGVNEICGVPGALLATNKSPLAQRSGQGRFLRNQKP